MLKNLFEVVKKVPEGVILIFSFDKNNIKLTFNNSDFLFNSYQIKDFPDTFDKQSEKILNFSVDELIKAIENTSFSMGNQDVRQYLNGLLFDIQKDYTNIVTSDGHRLSLAEVKTEKDKVIGRYILPRKATSELIKILQFAKELEISEIPISFSENYFSISIENKIIFKTRLISGSFPDYQSIIPSKEGNIVEVNKNDLLGKLNQASIFIDEKSKNVNLIFSDKNSLIIKSASERGSANISMKALCKSNIEISFNINYIIQILEKIQNEKVIIIMRNENESCLFLNKDNDYYKYVVMPVKI